MLVLAVPMVFAFGCAERARSESWVGYFLFPGDGTRHSIYLTLTIEAGRVTGVAYQMDSVTASVTGEVEGDTYLLRLSPEGAGSGEARDVRYRGARTRNLIYGEWIHADGTEGTLYLQLTTLPPGEAAFQDSAAEAAGYPAP